MAVVAEAAAARGPAAGAARAAQSASGAALAVGLLRPPTPLFELAVQALAAGWLAGLAAAGAAGADDWAARVRAVLAGLPSPLADEALRALVCGYAGYAGNNNSAGLPQPEPLVVPEVEDHHDVAEQADPLVLVDVLAESLTAVDFSPLTALRGVQPLLLTAFATRMAEAVPRLPRLANLDLTTHGQKFTLPACSDDTLLALSHHCPHLRTLNLSHNKGVSASGLEALSRGCPLLEELQLYDCALPTAVLAAVLLGLPRLRVLGHSELGAAVLLLHSQQAEDDEDPHGGGSSSRLGDEQAAAEPPADGLDFLEDDDVLLPEGEAGRQLAELRQRCREYHQAVDERRRDARFAALDAVEDFHADVRARVDAIRAELRAAAGGAGGSRPRLRLTQVSNLGEQGGHQKQRFAGEEAARLRCRFPLVWALRSLCPELAELRVRVLDQDLRHLGALARAGGGEGLRVLELRYHAAAKPSSLGGYTLAFLQLHAAGLAELTVYSHTLRASHFRLVGRHCPRMRTLWMRCNFLTLDEALDESGSPLFPHLDNFSLRVGWNELSASTLPASFVAALVRGAPLRKLYVAANSRDMTDAWLGAVLAAADCAELATLFVLLPNVNAELGPRLPLGPAAVRLALATCPRLAELGNLLVWSLHADEVRLLQRELREANAALRLVAKPSIWR